MQRENEGMYIHIYSPALWWSVSPARRCPASAVSARCARCRCAREVLPGCPGWVDTSDEARRPWHRRRIPRAHRHRSRRRGSARCPCFSGTVLFSRSLRVFLSPHPDRVCARARARAAFRAESETTAPENSRRYSRDDDDKDDSIASTRAHVHTHAHCRPRASTRKRQRRWARIRADASSAFGSDESPVAGDGSHSNETIT